jgi:3-deoxy-D-manno-octulosonic-acid transferase
VTPVAAPETLSLAVRATLGLYGLAWRTALHGLKRNKRLAEGWDERVMASGPPPQAELWVQAASGGEAYLAWELLRRLPEALPAGRPPLRALVTTFTSQGLGVLEQARAALAGSVDLLPAYFPFDLPGHVRKALQAVRPRAVVLLETELWPGLLAACRGQGVPVLIVNGRMTPKSLRGYSHLPWFWRALAPTRALAVSQADAERFARVFGPESVALMPNVKFDRLDFSAPPVQPGLSPLAAEASRDENPFVILGSVRREEEADALRIIQGLRERLPGAVIGLFPRHMQRVVPWRKLLTGAGVPYVLRSALTTGAAAAAPVILWDVFGELSAAFSLAACCFLGGSLAELGGQNFLEPLGHGVVPVIGPSWSNFAWVGEEIFEVGLVRRAADWRGVLDELCALAAEPPDRAGVRAAAAAYAQSRRGGAEAACQVVAECLISG